MPSSIRLTSFILTLIIKTLIFYDVYDYLLMSLSFADFFSKIEQPGCLGAER